MSIAQPRFSAIGVLMATAMIAVPTTSVCGGEPDERATVEIAEAVELLVPQSDLDSVSMSIVDGKLAMSLAVEAHVHMDVMEYALGSMSDANLKAHTERKLRMYRQLYSTLDDLTAGRVESMLARGSRRRDRETAADDKDKDSDGPPKKRTSKKRRGGGLRSVLQSTTTKAILRVRLEIAEQYALLLRAELDASDPGEFDRRYMNVELYDQMQILSMLRVFEQQASTEFGRILHVATTAAEGHMLEARQLVEQLKNSLPISGTPQQVVDTSDTSDM